MIAIGALSIWLLKSYEEQLGEAWLLKGLFWLGLIIGPTGVLRFLRCPECDKHYWPPTSRYCHHCGAGSSSLINSSTSFDGYKSVVLAMHPAAEETHLKVVFKERMAIFERLNKIDKVILKLSILVGVLCFFWAMFFWNKESDSLKKSLISSIWVGVIIGSIFWFFVSYLSLQLLRFMFWYLRARCPRCRNHLALRGSLLVPGHIDVEFAVPKFCPHCSFEF